MRNSQVAEGLVISWIDRQETPPMRLSDAVARYRLLSAAYELTEARGRDTTAIAERCNRLFDSLVESAAARLEAQPEPRRSVTPDKQLRRLARREDRRRTQLERVRLHLRGDAPSWTARVNAYLASRRNGAAHA
jgi:hypothetical protein